jgi:hypothetical protein
MTMSGAARSSNALGSGHSDSQAEGVVMHARVTTISGSPEQAEQGIANFRDNVIPTIKEMGGNGGVLLIDRASGKAMAITLWEDEAAMRASEERANELRRAASEELGAAEQPDVERYEVAVFEKS